MIGCDRLSSGDRLTLHLSHQCNLHALSCVRAGHWGRISLSVCEPISFMTVVCIGFRQQIAQRDSNFGGSKQCVVLQHSSQEPVKQHKQARQQDNCETNEVGTV